MTSAKVCANCGEPKTGRVNNIGFCNKPACVEAVMAQAFAPINSALKRIQR